MGTLLDSLRIVGPPETNKVMAAELSRLSRRALSRVPDKPQRPGSGTLIYPMDDELAWVATRYHRTSARTLWDLYRVDSARLEPLYDELVDLVGTDDRNWIEDGTSISIDARNVDSFAAGGRQIVGAVKNAIIDGFAKRAVRLHVEADAPAVRLWVRGQDEHLVVCLDLTGRPRHLRGYRLEGGAAPLREPLAAALVMLSRWDARSELLFDPMCGSGTIAIEAALMADARRLTADVGELAMCALPRFRKFARRGAPPLFEDTWPTIVGSDVDARALRSASANAERAGASDTVRFECQDFRDTHPGDIFEIASRAGRATDRGVILCNPPYGRRLQTREADEDILDLYADFGAFCSQFRGWRLGIIVGNPDFTRAFGHSPRVIKPMRTGAMRVNFYLFDL